MDLKTDDHLLQMLKKSAAHRPNSDELQKQRVSFVYGLMNNSSEMTKSRIQEVLAEHDGLRNS